VLRWTPRSGSVCISGIIGAAPVSTVVKPLHAMQKSKPIFGLTSVVMSGLAVVGIIVAYVLQGMTGLGVLLLSVFGLAFVGVVCAAVGLCRREHPITYSIVGLCANAAFPIVFFVLARMGVGSSWIDL